MTKFTAKPYSFIILWVDGDPNEEDGAFHWAGLAYDEEDAEIEARTAMLNQKIDQLSLTGDAAREYAESVGDVASFGGPVVSWTGGVNIWAASEMLSALQKLLSQCKLTSAYQDALDGEDPFFLVAVRYAEQAIAKAECRD